MSDCANEAMADPNGLNLPLTEGAIGCNDTMISNFDSAYTTSTNMHRMSSGAGAAAAQLDPKYVIAHQGPIGSTSQQHTAAAFFASKKASSSSRPKTYACPTSQIHRNHGAVQRRFVSPLT